MSTGQGYATRCGVRAEGFTWGTAIAAEQLIPFTSESLNRAIAKIESAYLDGKAGKKALYNSLISAMGDLQGEIGLSHANAGGFEFLLFGFSSGGSAGGGSGYHQYKLQDEIDESLTIALSKQVSCWEILGCKINTLEISGTAGETLKFNAGIIAKNLLRTGDAGIVNTISEINALTTTGDPDLAMFDDLVFRIGDQNNVLTGLDQLAISGFTISLNNNLSEPTFPTVTNTRTNSLLTIEPMRNGLRDINFSITIPRYESDQFFTWLNSETALQADFKVTTPSSHVLNLLFPNIRVVSVGAPVAGPEIVTQTVELQAIMNLGTNTYMTYEDTDAIEAEMGIEIETDRPNYVGYVIP